MNRYYFETIKHIEMNFAVLYKKNPPLSYNKGDLKKSATIFAKICYFRNSTLIFLIFSFSICVFFFILSRYWWVLMSRNDYQHYKVTQRADSMRLNGDSVDSSESSKFATKKLISKTKIEPENGHINYVLNYSEHISIRNLLINTCSSLNV